MGKKKKNDQDGQKNWFFVAGALIAAVIALVLAFMAGRDFFWGAVPDPEQDPEQDKTKENE